MQLNQITFTHERQRMYFSGIYRCIFTGRAMLWLVDGDGFRLIDVLRRRQLFLCGKQGCGKTTVAKAVADKLRSMGYMVNVVDEVRHEVHLEQCMLETKTSRSIAIMTETRPVDITIYCCQNSFLVPIEYRNDMILLTPLNEEA